MGLLAVHMSCTIENFITDHWQSSDKTHITITNWWGFCHTSNHNIVHFHHQNSLHQDWFTHFISCILLSQDSFFTLDNSPQQALFFIYMLLHAILWFIITAQHDTKLPQNSACMRMLSPVSLKCHNVTKPWFFLIVLNFHHLFKGGVSSLLYNVGVDLCGKLKAIHARLNLFLPIKHPYSIDLTHLFCQIHFTFPNHLMLILITHRKGKLLRYSIKKTLCLRFCFSFV
jgi:hypothetical protein